MKKILFALQTMVLGGVEKELITILRKLEPLNVDITLLLLYVQDKSIISRIPAYVKVVNLNIDKEYYCVDTISLAKKRLIRGYFFEGFSLLIKKALNIGQTGANLNINDIYELDDCFDTAICYHMHSPLMLKYVAEKVKANRKIAWMHNDFSTTGYNVGTLRHLLYKYDYFVGVCKKLSDEFINICPELSNKVVTIYNIIDENEVKLLANMPFDKDEYSNFDDKIVLLTVGRIEEQKGYDIAVRTALLLKNAGLEFVWLFIGYGKKEEEIRAMISMFGLEGCVKLLGKKENPYQYMNLCNVYVQPSRHEGFGLTISEAKVLEKPIICTNFIGADEQIVNGVNGIIVPVNDEHKIAESIISLCRDRDMQASFARTLHDESTNENRFDNIRDFILEV